MTWSPEATTSAATVLIQISIYTLLLLKGIGEILEMKYMKPLKILYDI